jgi:UDP-glucuronate decarboxylase
MNTDAANIKTVILCGGTGTRLREETEFKPKPLVEIGGKPILWHIMKIYNHYGYNNFVLALGYKGSSIKDHFIRQKHHTSDFLFNTAEGNVVNFLENGDKKDDFNIIFAETGLETPHGERVLKIKPYITEDIFMVTYGDGIADIDIEKLVRFHRAHGKIGTISGVHPESRWGLVNSDQNQMVTEFAQKPMLYDYVNGGFMVFNKEIFDYIQPGEMIEDALMKLIPLNQLALYKHEGFWYGMDTHKDFLHLNSLWEKNPKWKIWEKHEPVKFSEPATDTSNIISGDVQDIAGRIKNSAAKLEGKTILITGGSGFIGGYFLDVVSFLNENHFTKPCKIICLDNLIVGDQKRFAALLQKPYFEFIKHDITKPFSYDGPIDFIVHAASIASPTYYRQYPLETIDANIMGTRYLLQLALDKKAQSFLFMSTSETYGDPTPENIPTPETYRGNVSFTGPRACYDESKRLGETICMAFFEKYGVPVKIARPFNFYGPGLRLDDKRVIPDFVNNVLHNKPIVMHSDGKDTRTFCYASDAITGLFQILLSDANGEAFNVGNDTQAEVSMLDLAKAVRDISGKNVEIMHEASTDKNYMTDNPRRRAPDLSKIRRMLNYQPSVDLKTGLQRSIAWYKSNYNLS